MLRWTTAGESHGRALVAMVEGMVAGLSVTSDDIAVQLQRRRLGYGRGARMKFEKDQVTEEREVRHGLTLGGPIAIEIGNTEWPKWETVMAADPVPRFRRQLIDTGVCTDEELSGIDEGALTEVELALKAVMSADATSIDELDQDVYATPISYPV